MSVGFLLKAFLVLFAFLLAITRFPLAFFILFSLISNLLILRFLTHFFDQTVRNAIRTKESRRQDEADTTQMD